MSARITYEARTAMSDPRYPGITHRVVLWTPHTHGGGLVDWNCRTVARTRSAVAAERIAKRYNRKHDELCGETK